ncbi:MULTISPECIES: hypothetical protein [unclassified Oceanicaulis]|uniref:hypothetical protein n=1 Tax=unclassified Oceanicaulis TaxID=2632123 RepID=UPI0025DD5546|nr:MULTISPECIES: hypothetical protein [unclassified Oceanicaulis]|tara:strand:+ start:126 stop:491 length:366 start_codon:yes stop_codon:yes gene_type:complete
MRERAENLHWSELAHSKGEFHMQSDSSGPLIPMGALVMVGGIIWLGVAYAAPASVAYSQTVNYELMQLKTLHAIGGAACLVAGSVWVAAGIMLNKLAPKPVTALSREVNHDQPVNRIDSES